MPINVDLRHGFSFYIHEIPGYTIVSVTLRPDGFITHARQALQIVWKVQVI